MFNSPGISDAKVVERESAMAARVFDLYGVMIFPPSLKRSPLIHYLQIFSELNKKKSHVTRPSVSYSHARSQKVGLCNW